MQYLELTLTTLTANLALDEALLLQAESGGPEALRTWEWRTPGVVLGAGAKLAEHIHEDACQEDEMPLVRRSSGGGTVLLGAGCLNYALVLSYERHSGLREIRASYRHILSQMASALADLAPDVAKMGTSDLASAGRKFSGNSQLRKRRFLLHHGTLLYDFDIERVDRYLQAPREQPAYRNKRGHRDFLVNLPTSAAELSQRLRQLWEAGDQMTDWPRQQVQTLVTEKLGTEAWLRRR